MTVIYDFETQAKGEAHRICNDYLARSSHPEAGYGRNGRLARCDESVTLGECGVETGSQVNAVSQNESASCVSVAPVVPVAA